MEQEHRISMAEFPNRQIKQACRCCVCDTLVPAGAWVVPVDAGVVCTASCLDRSIESHHDEDLIQQAEIDTALDNARTAERLATRLEDEAGVLRRLALPAETGIGHSDIDDAVSAVDAAARLAGDIARETRAEVRIQQELREEERWFGIIYEAEQNIDSPLVHPLRPGRMPVAIAV